MRSSADRSGSRDSAVKQASTLSRLVARLPLLVSFGILTATWLAFTFTISIPEVLLRRHDIPHFIAQLIVFNLLMGLTILSLFAAATRSPGHPDPALAPSAYVPETADDHLARSAKEGRSRSDMTQTQTSKSRPPSIRLPAEPGLSSYASAGEAEDPDDIPLRFLRNSQWVTPRVQKDRPSPLPLFVSYRVQPGSMSRIPDHSSSAADLAENEAYTPTMTPFPLGLSPFVPKTATEAGDDDEWTDEGELTADADDEAELLAPQPSSTPAANRIKARRTGYWMEDDQPKQSREEEEQDMTLDQLEAEVAALLDEDGSAGASAGHGRAPGTVLMAKSNTGGPRFCRKCESWKPDRCHHCRFCKRCVLKMDHHCVWLATCVGHRNYKPFLLFISYGTLLAIYTCFEGLHQIVHLFTDIESYNSPELTTDGTGTTATMISSGPPTAPLIYMALTMFAAFFSLAMGGLTGYHWYLVCNNLSTLEQISHTYPSALLPVTSAKHGNTPGSAAGPAIWKPDHLLTRPERRRLTEEAREINVYDLGWRKNVTQTLLGDERGRRRRLRSWRVLRAFWPLSPADNGDGHDFEYDGGKLERLRRLTEELRLGVRRDTTGEEDDADDDASDDL